MTSSTSSSDYVGLFVDWNGTAGPGGINEQALAAFGGDYRFIKKDFEHFWTTQEWLKRADGGDLREERGALKRWARMHHLYDLQEKGHPAAPAISVDQMHEFGGSVHVYEGFDTLLAELRERVERTSGKKLWIAAITNAWAPVIRGTDVVRNGLIDQVVGQEFLDGRTWDGRPIAVPSGGVGEETKPLAVRFVSANPTRQSGLGPVPPGARIELPINDVAVIPGHSRVALANGFSDVDMINYIAQQDGIMVGVRNADFNYPDERLVRGTERYRKAARFAREDRRILSAKLHADRLTAILDADYRTSTRSGRRTRAALLDYLELAACIEVPNLAHQIIRGQAVDPRPHAPKVDRGVAPSFSLIG